MKQIQIALPTLDLIAGTRALLGGGIALLLAERMTPAARRTTGWILFTVGALSTLPLAARVFGQKERPHQREPAAAR